jgi:hypothetical protein
MYKTQNQKYVDLQIYVKKATKYFSQLVKQVQITKSVKLVLLSSFQKNSQNSGGYLPNVPCLLPLGGKHLHGGSLGTPCTTSCFEGSTG